MVTFDFPLLTRRVKVKFICNVCGELVESEWFSVPNANFGEDTHDKSLNIKDDCYAVCPKCGKQFDITIGESICGGEGWIENLPEGWKVDLECEPGE